MKKIGILTSSRADYSIYIPLIKELVSNKFFSVEIIAFGSHLSKEHGYTVDTIKNDSLAIIKCIDVGYTSDDSPYGIAKTMGITTEKFAQFWTLNSYNLIFCLGDRYEMFAAVASVLPFQIKIAHLYGGETTLGAIDNSFRHCLTHFSDLHYVACEKYKKRVLELTEDNQNVFNYGHLSIDNLKHLTLLNLFELKALTNVDFTKPTILCTFHPETIAFERNEEFVDILSRVFTDISDFQLVITMPNTDTGGMVIRKRFEKLEKECDWIFCKENLGTIGYLSAMKYCEFMLGNTSSGFVEASFFPKHVINLGDRQKGRILTPNIIQTPITYVDIMNSINLIRNKKINLEYLNFYGLGNTAKKIHESIILFFKSQKSKH